MMPTFHIAKWFYFPMKNPLTVKISIRTLLLIMMPHKMYLSPS